MGYPWVERLGHCTDDFFRSQTCSALMVLWLDAVFQLVTSNPDAFEFKSSLPCTIGRHLYSCRFGNFLGATEEQRQRLGLAKNTMSLWSFINAQRQDFLNSEVETEEWKHYAPQKHQGKLEIPHELTYWREFHHEVNGLADMGSMEKLSSGIFSGGCGCMAPPV